MATESSTMSYSLQLAKAKSVVLTLLKKKDKKINFHQAVGKALKDYPAVGKRELITTVNMVIAEARDRKKNAKPAVA